MSYVLLLEKKSKPEVRKSLKKHCTYCQETFIRISQRQNMGEGNQLLIKTSPPSFEGIVKAWLLLWTAQNILLLFKLVLKSISTLPSVATASAAWILCLDNPQAYHMASAVCFRRRKCIMNESRSSGLHGDRIIWK